MTDVTKCTNCGLCRRSCPIYRVTLNESDSPRGKAILLKNNIISEHILKCTLCKSCEDKCPLKIDFEITKLRAKLAHTKETPANKKMIENIRAHGNPFGKKENGKMPDDLYCC
ncbi:(Fe-S)-binding protein [Candidatus Woesearchaeota archaeon]|nr:(Fe-S)-binding protein [Candidatus Woesearchaeota archaeon]MBW3021858.1 (Fe-S)-binding protein [Candidatus Woesearchaeota archaeon]